MRNKISNQFFINYLIVFFLSILAAIFALLLLSFADSVISKTLVKNQYPASVFMQDDYNKINAERIVDNGGGLQIINEDYKVVYSAGINTLGHDQLTPNEFTDFLIQSKSKGVQYHYDILYNEKESFWLIVTFPASIRFEFSLVYNKEAASIDMDNVTGAFIAVIIFYLLLLAIFAIIFSKITSARITRPLKKLCESTKRLKEGDYSTRVDLHLKNEFDELQDTFNKMAERIEYETALRRQSEDDRKKMIMDISHDLKNPLSSITGYAELCLKKSESLEKKHKDYIEIIVKNSQRASRLLTDLFELSKLESPEFKLKAYKIDVCEYLRQICADFISIFESAGFTYNFNIPEKLIYAMIDPQQMSRVLFNLGDNVIQYNPVGTTVTANLYEEEEKVIILFKDNGIGIPSDVAKNIFKPFVRVDNARNSQTGGTGLGLSIAHKIIKAHSGSIELVTDKNKGCEFLIILPKI